MSKIIRTCIIATPFIDCNELQKIDIDEDNNNYCVINGILYSKDKTTLIEALPKVSDIEIPDTVKEIKNSAFKNCYNLQNFKMPESIQTIEDEAFSGCRKISTIIFPKNSETISIGSKAFDRCNSLTYVLLLSGNISAYDDSFQDNMGLKIYSYKNDDLKGFSLYDFARWKKHKSKCRYI